MSEEVTVPGYVPTPVWYGFVAPAKTPPEIIAILSTYIQNAMQSPDVKTKLTTLGAQLTSSDSAQFSAEIKNEYEKSSALANKLGSAK